MKNKGAKAPTKENNHKKKVLKMKNIHPDQILSHILQMVKDVLEKGDEARKGNIPRELNDKFERAIEDSLESKRFRAESYQTQFT